PRPHMRSRDTTRTRRSSACRPPLRSPTPLWWARSGPSGRSDSTEAGPRPLMRILHVNKFLYRRGGAEAYMEVLADLQVAAGHTVSFFGMAHPLNTHLEYASHYPRDIE